MTVPDDYQTQVDQLLKTQADMQEELTQCKSKLETQNRLMRNILKKLGYQSLGNWIPSTISDMPSILLPC